MQKTAFKSFAEASMNIVKLQNTHIATAPVHKHAEAICMETNINRYRTSKQAVR